MNAKPLLHHLLLIALLSVFFGTAQAADVYDFDIVIFERPNGGTDEFWPESPGEPDMSLAVGSLDSMRSGSGMGSIASRLAQKGMVVLENMSWRQVPRGRDSNSWYRVDSGRLSGLLRVTKGRFLHFETDLLLRDAHDPAKEYRIRLSRRMRSDELHYVDNAKLGVLIRAERVAATKPADDASDDTGEPKPAQPASKS